MLANLGADLSLEQVKSLIPTQKSYHQTEDKYNTISAMIKSIRGSDPDAAIYRMAKMQKILDWQILKRSLLLWLLCMQQKNYECQKFVFPWLRL